MSIDLRRSASQQNLQFSLRKGRGSRLQMFSTKGVLRRSGFNGEGQEGGGQVDVFVYLYRYTIAWDQPSAYPPVTSFTIWEATFHSLLIKSLFYLCVGYPSDTTKVFNAPAQETYSSIRCRLTLRSSV